MQKNQNQPKVDSFFSGFMHCPELCCTLKAPCVQRNTPTLDALLIFSSWWFRTQYGQQKNKNAAILLAKNKDYLHSSLFPFSRGCGAACSPLALKSGFVNSHWAVEETHLDSSTWDWHGRQGRNCDSTCKGHLLCEGSTPPYGHLLLHLLQNKILTMFAYL